MDFVAHLMSADSPTSSEQNQKANQALGLQVVNPALGWQPRQPGLLACGRGGEPFEGDLVFSNGVD